MHIKLSFTIDGQPKRLIIATEKGKSFVSKEEKIKAYFGASPDGAVKQSYISDFQYASKEINFWNTKEGKRKKYERRTGLKAEYPKRR